MKNISEAFQLFEEKSYQEAYDAFSEIYQSSKKNYQALYFRAVTDYLYLKKKLDQTKLDLLILVNNKNQFTIPSLSYLIYLYDEQFDYQNVVKYGVEFINRYQKQKDNNASDTYHYVIFIVAKAMLLDAMSDKYNDAIKYLDIYLNEVEDVPIEVYSLKLNLLLDLDNFEESKKIINTLQQNFGSCYLVYYSRFMYNNYLGEYNKDNNNNDYHQNFKDAFNDLKICLNYAESPENEVFLKNLQFEMLVSDDDYENAYAFLKEINPGLDNNDYVIRTLQLMKELKDDNILNHALEIYDKNPTPTLAFEISRTYRLKADNKEDIKIATGYCLSAYKETKNADYLYEYCYQNGLIFNFSDNVPILDDYLNEHKDDGRAYFLLGVAYQYLNKSFDEQIKCFKKSQELGYIDEYQLYEHISPIIENPKVSSKKIKKLLPKDLSILDSFSIQKMAVRYLYGEDNFKIDYPQAFKYLQMVMQEDDNDPCTNRLLGRYYEIAEQNNDAAFVSYSKAYRLASEDPFLACNCAYGTLAHAYIKGIGIDVSIDKAKSLILDGINKLGVYSDNMLIYLYAYFAMQNEPDFDLNTALGLLEINLPYYRYEITRALYLKRIKTMLNKQSKADDDFINNTLKHLDKGAKKYYQENCDVVLPYPYYAEY